MYTSPLHERTFSKIWIIKMGLSIHLHYDVYVIYVESLRASLFNSKYSTHLSSWKENYKKEFKELKHFA